MATDIVEMSKFLAGDVSNLAGGIAGTVNTMATHPNATRYLMGKAGGWIGRTIQENWNVLKGELPAIGRMAVTKTGEALGSPD